MLSTRIEVVTPDAANHYLKFNTGNRPVRRSVVKSLAKSIERGEWVLTHQGIAFSKDGRLLDGQHRLAAIIEANKPVPMSVTVGLEDQAFMVLDKHQRRSHADSLGLDRRALEPVRLIATITLSQSTISPQQLKPFADVFFQTSVELQHFAPRNTKVFSASSVRAAAIFRALRHPEQKDAIFDSYRRITLHQLETFSPVETAFFKRLLNHSASSGSDQKLMFAAGCICFSAENSELTSVRVGDGGAKYATELREFCLQKGLL